MATIDVMQQAEQTVVREPMSLEQFFALDLEFAELVDGQPVLVSTPTGPHQLAAAKLLLALDPRVPAEHCVLGPLDWILTDGPGATVRQPDLVIIPVEYARQPRLTSPPLLAIEILSPSSVERDLVAKRREYARAGCEHYWIVNLTVPEIVALRLDGERGEYVETGRLIGGTAGTLREPVELTLDPSQLVP